MDVAKPPPNPGQPLPARSPVSRSRKGWGALSKVRRQNVEE